MMDGEDIDDPPLFPLFLPLPSLPPSLTAVMQKFNHPHIIKLYGVLSNQQMTYIIMELASLGQVGREGGR